MNLGALNNAKEMTRWDGGFLYAAEHEAKPVWALLVPGFAGVDAQVLMQVWAGVKHSEVVPLLYSGAVREGFVLAWQAPEGSWMGQGAAQALNPVLAVNRIIQLLDALALVHKHQLVHGALSPAWLGVRANGYMQLAGVSLGNIGVPVNRLSPAQYQAPEVREGGTPSRVSDVYSVGVLLYRFLTGKEAGTTVQAPSTVVSSLAPSLDAVVLKATGPQEDRYPDAAMFLTAVHGALTSALTQNSAPSSGDADLLGRGATVFAGRGRLDTQSQEAVGNNTMMAVDSLIRGMGAPEPEETIPAAEGQGAAVEATLPALDGGSLGVGTHTMERMDELIAALGGNTVPETPAEAAPGSEVADQDRPVGDSTMMALDRAIHGLSDATPPAPKADAPAASPAAPPAEGKPAASETEKKGWWPFGGRS